MKKLVLTLISLALSTCEVAHAQGGVSIAPVGERTALVEVADSNARTSLTPSVSKGRIIKQNNDSSLWIQKTDGSWSQLPSGGGTVNVAAPIAGDGSIGSPLKLTDGTVSGQVPTWSGTAWNYALPTSYTANNGVLLSGSTFSLLLDPTTSTQLSKSASGLKFTDYTFTKGVTLASGTVTVNNAFYYPPITRLAWGGDSITAYADLQTDTIKATTHQAWFDWFLQKEIPTTLYSTNYFAFATPGIVAGQFLTTNVPAIVASTPKPSHIIICIGTNDVSYATAMATFRSNIDSITSTLRASNIEPIYLSIPGRKHTDAAATFTSQTAYNDEIKASCVANHVLFCDLRNITEGTTAGKALVGSLYDGVHPEDGLYRSMGKALAAFLSPYINYGKDIFDYTAVNSNNDLTNPFTVSTPPTADYVAGTSSLTYIDRADGITGKWGRVTLNYNPSRTATIGAGTGSVIYTAVAPRTANDLLISHDNKAGNTTLTTSVMVCEDGKIKIRVTPKQSPSMSTAAEVATAVNAAASAYVTATTSGGGGGAVSLGENPAVWILENETTAGLVKETLLNANDSVRLLVEVRVLSGELAQATCELVANKPTLQTFSSFAGGAALSTQKGSAVTVLPQKAGSKFVIATNWRSVGNTGGVPTYYAFTPRIYLGGRNCVAEIGRVVVQKK